jgi:hypothetical protein
MAHASRETASRRVRFFWPLWAFDAVIGAVVLFFFFWGLADGTVSSFNILLWLAMLAVVGVVVGGSYALQATGRAAAAIPLLLLLAMPGLAAVVFFVSVLVLQPRWN